MFIHEYYKNKHIKGCIGEKSENLSENVKDFQQEQKDFQKKQKKLKNFQIIRKSFNDFWVKNGDVMQHVVEEPGAEQSKTSCWCLNQ